MQEEHWRREAAFRRDVARRRGRLQVGLRPRLRDRDRHLRLLVQAHLHAAAHLREVAVLPLLRRHPVDRVKGGDDAIGTGGLLEHHGCALLEVVGHGGVDVDVIAVVQQLHGEHVSVLASDHE